MIDFGVNYRKSVLKESLVENELDEKPNILDAEKDEEKAVSTDEQVANRLERLNLYFEKENVGTLSCLYNCRQLLSQ